MMKKKFTALIFSFIFLTAGQEIFSLGLGAQLDAEPGFVTDGKNPAYISAGAAFSMKQDKIPLSTTVCTDYDFLKKTFNAVIKNDWWIINPRITDYSSFFAGPGAAIGVSTWKSGDALSASFYAAPRAVFGINWIFYDGFFEPYIQCAVEPGFSISEKTTFCVKTPVNAGVRFYY